MSGLVFRMLALHTGPIAQVERQSVAGFKAHRRRVPRGGNGPTPASLLGAESPSRQERSAQSGHPTPGTQRSTYASTFDDLVVVTYGRIYSTVSVSVAGANRCQR